MAAEMEWSPDFCLVCDRQTDGSVYCGEACRLAEYEQANAGSTASSPAFQQGPVLWTSTTLPSNNFYLAPALNFQAIRYGNSQSTFARPHTSPVPLSKPVLTPSSSQSSLFSLRSSSSTASEPAQLSDEARRELRAYASSFDQSRYHRRQSTN